MLEAGRDIDPAMEMFRSLVITRALRMTDAVFEKLPEAEAFAADKGGAGAEPTPEPQIADALGIETPEEARATPPPLTSAGPDERVERVLRLADESGSGATLRDFVARALRLPLQVRGYQRTLTITPPTTKAIALIAMTPDSHQRGLVTTWVAPGAFSAHFPRVTPERFDEQLSGIRGVRLDGPKIDALVQRLEKLLAPEPHGAPVAAESSS